MNKKRPHYAEIYPSRVEAIEYCKQDKDSPYQNVVYHSLPTEAKNNERKPGAMNKAAWWLISAIIGWLAVIGACQVLVWARPVWVWVDK